jgi:hypothetical protein
MLPSKWDPGPKVQAFETAHTMLLASAPPAKMIFLLAAMLNPPKIVVHKGC